MPQYGAWVPSVHKRVLPLPAPHYYFKSGKAILNAPSISLACAARLNDLRACLRAANAVYRTGVKRAGERRADLLPKVVVVIELQDLAGEIFFGCGDEEGWVRVVGLSLGRVHQAMRSIWCGDHR
jgi:hypothetical protein